MYHCITAAEMDPWGICVSPTAFDEHLQVLARSCAVVDLGELTDPAPYTTTGSTFALTFDDGYADNLLAALPILERHDMPATVFVIGSALDRTREFWWDALERAILSDRLLPARLDFPFGGRRQYRIDDDPLDVAETRNWRADRQAPACDRQQLFRDLWDAIVVLEPAAQDDAVDFLLEWAGHPVTVEPARPALTQAQFAELLAHPLITIGSHTVDHVSLTDLPADRQFRQIDDGRRRMAELTGLDVTRFSYPYGRNNSSARAAARRAGIEIACTSAAMPAVAGDDPLTFPRLQVSAPDGEQFARWLTEVHRLAV